jgi:hypothetical protein
LTLSREVTNGPVVLQGEDNLRTQYVPPEPTVKILKRPARNSVIGSVDGPVLNGDSKPRQPIKTLQQVKFECSEIYSEHSIVLENECFDELGADM